MAVKEINPKIKKAETESRVRFQSYVKQSQFEKLKPFMKDGETINEFTKRTFEEAYNVRID